MAAPLARTSEAEGRWTSMHSFLYEQAPRPAHGQRSRLCERTVLEHIMEGISQYLTIRTLIHSFCPFAVLAHLVPMNTVDMVNCSRGSARQC